MNLSELAKNFSTEESAIGFLENKLWPDGPVCPHCGLIGEAFRMESKPESENKMRPGLWKCSGCRKTFRVTVGTIFEDSHIPLHKWMMAIHLMSASKKGISAHQLHRMLGLGYRAAWFMAHRIRYAMTEKSTTKLSGIVEVDETYVGGKLRTGVT
jgi:transposase-like protein